MEEEKELALPAKENFSEWYNDILVKAEIMDVRYPVKGLYVWNPFGFSIRKNVYSIIRELLDREHEETLFPLLIPENEFMKEAKHIKGFEEEVYWVTHGGTSPLEVNLAIRPTSETAIYPIYRLWVRSHADLPIKYYQIVNTFRYETKHTRPLIRLREITSFKEAHTVHETWDDAAAQVDEAIKIYQEFYERLCLPVLPSRRPEWDKFPGADYTIAVDAMMPDGRTLQVGTAHHLGNNFAKTFDIEYEDPHGEQVYAYQSCYGISERCIAAMISIHGDDKGLILPPEIAPIQVIIIPVIFKNKDKEKILEACKNVKKTLESSGVQTKIDTSDRRPGAKYYKWEMKGVPLRIEIGPKDLKNEAIMMVRRDTGDKEQVSMDDINNAVADKFDSIKSNLYEKAKTELENNIIECESLGEIENKIVKGILKIPWCGQERCNDELEERIGAGILGIPVNQNKNGSNQCPMCGCETNTKVYVSRAY
ncbi:MAG: proline--tRNA ligase [Methanohalobium sp.]|uniref:proline--tRNA ligase n=1 Tax=Methanohalobium sp. TaxID=2837493 RepID=UPI00397A4476